MATNLISEVRICDFCVSVCKLASTDWWLNELDVFKNNARLPAIHPPKTRLLGDTPMNEFTRANAASIFFYYYHKFSKY